LYSEKGKEDVLGGRDSKIVTHQFKGPHKGLRIGGESEKATVWCNGASPVENPTKGVGNPCL